MMIMNMLKMFLFGKVFVLMIDYNIVYIKIIISFWVSMCLKNLDGGMVIFVDISFFLNFFVLDFEGEFLLFVLFLCFFVVLVFMINKRIEENLNWS